MEPFTTLHIALQDGSYDHPHRMFFSIPHVWESVTGLAMDFRELIPEFFFNAHFLTNENGFDLGKRYSIAIDNVQLPRWARSPQEFIAIHRRALEGSIVSELLNSWIDLIFGVNQRSEEHNSVFHSYSYSDSILLDPETVSLAKQHAANFGVVPQKLFHSPHPRRETPRAMSEVAIAPPEGKVLAFSNGFALMINEVVVNLATRTAAHINGFRWYGYALCSISSGYIITATGTEGHVHVFDRKENTETGVLPHRTSIVHCLASVSDTVLLIGGSDCSLYIWNPSTLTLVAKIASHSVSIVGVAGNMILDRAVSIDEEGNVFVYNIGQKKVVHLFALEQSGEFAHAVRLFDSGTIAIASSSPGKLHTHGSIAFYDLCGRSRGRVHCAFRIEQIEAIQTTDFCEYLAVTTSKRSLCVMDCVTTEMILNRSHGISPRFVTYAGRRTLMVVKERGDTDVITAVDF
jgi:hypothetical protein